MNYDKHSEQTPILNIVLVEDSVDLCKVWEEALMLSGYHVTCFFRGEDALEDLDAIKACDILISDYYLPDINGLDLFAKVRLHRPDLPAILLTGARESIFLKDIRNIPKTKLLFKPLELHELEKCVESLRK
jgi:DNA-binding response OmpR family regulator